MWEQIYEIATDLRTIIAGSVGFLLTALYGVRKWIQSGKGAAIIVTWAINKAVKMFSENDDDAKENQEKAEIVIKGVMSLPFIQSKMDKLDKMALESIDIMEAELLHLKKELLDVENRLALNVDSQPQQKKMVTLKAEIEGQIKKLNDKIKS